MIQLSSITNAISSAAQSVAVHTKNLCTSSKVDAVFRTIVGAVQAHPYITLLGVGVAVYCCREQIGGLVNKVKQAAHSLYTKATESMTSLINLFRRSSASISEAPTNSDSSEIPAKVAKKIPSETNTEKDGTNN